ncbi:hybrid sensor histidine kinase/response regulator [Nonlabens dokdonensis]|nr:response regulator [Nonlabens dokdonensis]
MKNTNFLSLFLLMLLSLMSCQEQDILNEEERKWINGKEEIIVAVYPNYNYPPYLFKDKNGDSEGILMDYLELIEKKAAYKFQIKEYDNFTALMNDAKAGELDLILEIQETPSRNKYLNFYSKLFESPYVIVGKKTPNIPKSRKDFETATFYLPEDVAIVENLKIQFPNAKISSPCKDDLDCLKMIAQKNDAFFIGPRAVTNYHIESNNLSNLKIIKNLGKDYQPSLAVVKDDSMLNDVIYNLVQSVSYEEKKEIKDRWLSQFKRPFYKKSFFWIVLLGIAIFLMIIILGINRYLKYVIRENTKELEKAKTIAERNNKLKTSFINNITHEMRTPMNAIMGFSGLLSKEVLTDTQRSNYLEIINNACLRLMNMMDNVLEVSLLQTGDVSVQKNTVLLDDLLKTVVYKHEENVKLKKIDCNCVIDISEEQNCVVMDQSKLQKIVDNLLDNAIKFTSKGEVTFNSTIDGDTLIITITDTGIGISEERLKTVYDGYSKSNLDMKDLYDGLGLGLTICKAYVSLLNGKINIDSELGKGTTVNVYLPVDVIDQQQLCEKEEMEPQERSHSFHKVLIAEDVNLNYLFLKSLLDKVVDFDFQFIRAVNGQEAIDLVLREKDIDIIFMDIQMPVMDGYQATTAIKKSHPSIPIIIQTAYSTAEDREQAFKAGADDFITKPIKPKTIENIFKKYLKTRGEKVTF